MNQIASVDDLRGRKYQFIIVVFSGGTGRIYGCVDAVRREAVLKELLDSGIAIADIAIMEVSQILVSS